jgi:uncharacterized repeat protein (TIGR03803 family)
MAPNHLLVGLSLSLFLHVIVQAQQFEVLRAFRTNDGMWPQGVLIQTEDGALYGTTHYGSVTAAGSWQGGGTVFKITTDGQFTKLLDLGNPTGPRYIRAGLTRARDGMFYGTTYRSTLLRGLVENRFETWATVDPAYISFLSSALIEGSDGALYGVGLSSSGNSGTVFRVTTNGTSSLVATFSGINAAPTARLLQASDGYLYGTSERGGTNNLGTVFRCDTNGNLTVIASFNGTNGAQPMAGLVEAGGWLYGTTYAGGAHALGTVFRMTTSGTLDTLVSFNRTNGASPTAELCLGRNGLWYGTTFSGGSNNVGTIFQMTANGELTTLASFGGTNGSNPYAGVIQGIDGHLYGGAQRGGAYQAGTIYRIVLPSLEVTRHDTNLVIAWPTNANDFVLQSSDINTPLNWADSTNEVIELNGAFTATNPLSAGGHLFRLRKQ